jgi:DNA-directed RNA polymerase beta subunit
MPQERKNFGKLREVIPPPNLIENQIFSFNDFLQLDQAASARKNVGLDAVFREAFPVESNNGNFRLEYLEYGLVLPKQTELECIREGTTYAISVMLKLRLREKAEAQRKGDVIEWIALIHIEIESGTSVSDCTSCTASARMRGSSASGMPAFTSSMCAPAATCASASALTRL